MTEPLDDFLRAYDAWADSDAYGGHLFDRMLEARADLDAAMREAGEPQRSVTSFANATEALRDQYRMMLGEPTEAP